MRIIHCTAASLKAMLCFVESGITVPIAYDRDDLAKPLAEKLKAAIGVHGGSQSVQIMFTDAEADLQRQFEGCAMHIAAIFDKLKADFSR